MTYDCLTMRLASVIILLFIICVLSFLLCLNSKIRLTLFFNLVRTSDLLLTALYVNCLKFVGLDIGGEMNMTSGIQVAQLALKHRQNKKQQQRIIVFAGRYSFI